MIGGNVKYATLKQLYEALGAAITAENFEAVDVYSRAIQRIESIQ